MATVKFAVFSMFADPDPQILNRNVTRNRYESTLFAIGQSQANRSLSSLPSLRSIKIICKLNALLPPHTFALKKVDKPNFSQTQSQINSAMMLDKNVTLFTSINSSAQSHSLAVILKQFKALKLLGSFLLTMSYERGNLFIDAQVSADYLLR